MPHIVKDGRESFRERVDWYFAEIHHLTFERVFTTILGKHLVAPIQVIFRRRVRVLIQFRCRVWKYFAHVGECLFGSREVEIERRASVRGRIGS